MKTLYLECNSGISGDMLVAALIDLGADQSVLEKVLSGIQDEGVSVKIGRVSKSGIDCCDFDVRLDEKYGNYDHDMEYLYGHLKDDHGEYHHEHAGHDHEHDHGEHHHEHAGHDHEHAHGEHSHVHRNLRDVTDIINSLDMTPSARSLAIKVFEILAQAEAKAHNRSIEEVHFHEVGAIDSIIDIVAAAVCFDNLAITDVIIPKLCDGTGSVRCQHGILPVPVPAVLNIAVSYGLPLSITSKKGEYVTPTGAAFAAAVMTSTMLPEVIIPAGVGLGAGKREYEQASILRAILLK